MSKPHKAPPALVIAQQLLVLAAVLLLSSCAGTTKTGNALSGSHYSQKLDAWRCSNAALRDACSGDAEAIRASFLSAYVRVSEPMMGGEDLENMYANFSQLLKALGDVKFAASLQTVRPEVRSAVHWFLESKEINKEEFPQTFSVLAAAPTIDWPLDQAYRQL